MKVILHYLFILFGLTLMLICIIPAMVIYMFTQKNIMPLIELELSYYERKYFNQ
jgi:hypothetical protein